MNQQKISPEQLQQVARSNFDGKAVLITGGAGFIGSHLARRLVASGARVTIVDSMIPEYGGNLANLRGIEDQVQLNVSDVRDHYSMKYLVRDRAYLFNLAGQTSHLDSMTDPFTDLEINARAQLSILEACRQHNQEIKIVFCGTRQVYGKPQYLPVDEQHPTYPVDTNGIHKMAGEWYHLLYNNVYGIRASILRLTNTYGPSMRIKDARQTFLGIWIRCLLEGKPFLVFGDGTQVRDYNYVDDVVDALLLTAVSPKANGQVFNLGADERFTLRETAELLVKVWGKGSFEVVPFPTDRKAIDIGDYYGDYQKLSDRVGWQPNVSLAQGLKQTFAYFSDSFADYVN